MMNLASESLDFQSLRSNVLSPKCIACHSGSSPGGGYDVSTYAGIMSGGRVIPYDPAGSLLIQRMRDGSMPQGGSVSSEEIKSVENWILRGAPPSTDEPLPTPVPIAPVANAGADQMTSLPTVNFSLFGSAADSDGTIASAQWAQVSGPNAILNGATTLTLTLTNLNAGTYIFRLTVTDNDGLSNSDTVQLLVYPAANVVPVANAGPDKSITLPTASVTLNGSGSDSDGTIAAYAWSKISGGAATLSGAATANLSLSGLVAGSYVFRLQVTDNSGGSSTDDVSVMVNAANNAAPTVNAGADKSVTLPTNSTSLIATASDSDGTIASIQWSQVSGPSTATISAANLLSMQVQSLVSGTYTFQIKVTDNLGSTAVDAVLITVAAPANNLPVANAGADKTVTLPTSSTSLSGSGTDSDGTIASYLWRQVSGPSAAVLSASSMATTNVSGLLQGSYVFELKVTDDRGATGVDSMTVTVLAGANPNAKYSWIFTNILSPRCLNCHGAGGGGGYDARTYTSNLTRVTPFNAAGSLLFTETNSGSMPKGSTKLTATQLQAIKDWINAGALNN